MRRFIIFSVLLLSSLPIVAQNTGAILFDDGWTFHRGALSGAKNADFDDSKWRKIDLPHDWSIEDLPGTHPLTV